MIIADVIKVLQSHEYMSGDTKRRHKGQDEIFTPMPAVNELIKLVKKICNGDYKEKMLFGVVEDPTCGDGNMLVGALIEKLVLYKKEFSTDEVSKNDYRCLVSGIRGNDIDAGNIAVAKNRLTEPLIKVEGMCKSKADRFMERILKQNFATKPYDEYRKLTTTKLLV